LSDVKAILACPTSDTSRLCQLYAHMSNKLIGRPRRRDSDDELYGDTPPVPCEPGPFIRRFQDKFTKQLQELCGKSGEALMKLCKVNDFSEVM